MEQTIADTYHLLLLSITGASVVLQLYVMFLIYYASPSSMKNYRYFLFTFTFWDMLFTITIGFLIDPEPMFPEGCGAFVNGLLSHLGPYSGNIGISFGVLCGAGVLCAANYCLIYRYVVIQHTNPAWKDYFFSPCSYLLFQIIGWTLGLIFAWLAYEMFAKPHEVFSLLSPFPNSLSRYTSSPHKAVIVLDKSNRRSLALGGAILGGFLFYESISLALALKIMAILRANIHLYSERTYKMHMHLTALLIAQLLAPLILIGMPVCSGLLVLILGGQITKLIGQMGVLMLALYASVNSLLTLFFVAPFRRFTFNRAKKVAATYFSRSSRTQSQSHNPSMVVAEQVAQGEQRVNSVGVVRLSRQFEITTLRNNSATPVT